MAFSPIVEAPGRGADERSEIRRSRHNIWRVSLRSTRPTVCLTLFDRHEDAVADLATDGLRQMSLAGGVLDQDHFAGADHAGLAVARGYLHAGIEVDDVLPARRRVPVEVVVGLDLAEDDAGGR